MKKKLISWKRYVIWLVILIRTSAALYILVDPFWGILLAFIADTYDSYILEGLSVLTYMEYELLDKNLDLVMFATMLIVSSRFGMFNLFLVLLLFRLIGHEFFRKTKDEKYLFYFPNYFEAAFFVLISLQSKNLLPLEGSAGFWMILFVAFLVQILREVWLHILIPSYIKNGNHYPRILTMVGYNRVRKLVND